MNTNELSIEQLKAMVYDEIQKMEIAQNNIREINKVIAQKQNVNNIQKPEIGKKREDIQPLQVPDNDKGGRQGWRKKYFSGRSKINEGGEDIEKV